MDNEPDMTVVPKEEGGALDHLQEDSAPPLKAVAHLLDGTIVKGELLERPKTDLEETLRELSGDHPSVFVLNSEADEEARTFRLDEVKALFIVDSLEGNQSRQSMRFYSHGPEVSGLWVEVQFKDGEIMEGLVHNSVRHLTSPGFLLTPTDPGSNNRAVYVNKAAIVSFRVLGLRSIDY